MSFLIKISLFAASTGALGILAYQIPKLWSVVAGYTAKVAASAILIAKRPAEQVIAQELKTWSFTGVRISIHSDGVSAHMPGGFSRIAVLNPVGGCTLLPQGQKVVPEAPAHFRKPEVTRSELPIASLETLADTVDLERLQLDMEQAFAKTRMGIHQQTRAVVVVYKGQVITHRYGPGFSPDTLLAGWSLTKSVINALTGILVKQGKLWLDEPTGLRAWQGADDPRAKITLRQLLQMSSGLDFSEIYSRHSDATQMLFLSGSAAGYAAARKLKYPPGSHWSYASGDSNILSQLIREQFGTHADYLRLPYEALFAPLGMDSALMECDTTGTYIGSSFMHATALDWAKFGQLFLQDGLWNGERILPEGWVDFTRAAAPAAPFGQYGAHFWRNASAPVQGGKKYFPALPADLYYASGFEEQRIGIIPSRELVVVRLGLTYPSQRWDFGEFLSPIVGAFPEKT